MLVEPSLEGSHQVANCLIIEDAVSKALGKALYALHNNHCHFHRGGGGRCGDGRGQLPPKAVESGRASRAASWVLSPAEAVLT